MIEYYTIILYNNNHNHNHNLIVYHILLWNNNIYQAHEIPIEAVVNRLEVDLPTNDLISGERPA